MKRSPTSGTPIGSFSYDASSLDQWMHEALEGAKKAAGEGEVPVGALVIHENQIIGRSYNRREQSQDPTAHAEILAIQEASRALGTWRLNECLLVVTLEPCLMCLAAAQQSRMGEIVYGAEDSKGGALSLGYTFHQDERINHRFPVTFSKKEECSEVLKEFFKMRRQAKKL